MPALQTRKPGEAWRVSQALGIHGEARTPRPREGSQPHTWHCQRGEGSRLETCPILFLHLRGLEKVPQCRLLGSKGLDGHELSGPARLTLPLPQLTGDHSQRQLNPHSHR